MAYSDAFSVGKDCTIDIINPLTGTLQAFAILTSVQFSPDNKELQSTGIDGVNRFAYVPMGGKVALEFDRQNGDLDAFAASMEAAYYAGASVPQVQITQTIREQNGSISQYRYEGVAINISDLGTWKGDDKVSPKAEARYSRRVKVS